jgi:hypothetical protein
VTILEKLFEFLRFNNTLSMKRSRSLSRPTEFYDRIRKFKLFGPIFNSTEFAGIEFILKDCGAANWPISWTAYALATAYHETAGTMQPIMEYGGKAYFTKMYDVTGSNPARARRMGNNTPGDGPKYCGRGYVQLTWKNNYIKATNELGHDFVNKPELALVPDFASDIMIRGMEEGWFTGYRLRSFLGLENVKASEPLFKKCRLIINGTDKASTIADYAIDFQEALLAGGWQ